MIDSSKNMVANGYDFGVLNGGRENLVGNLSTIGGRENNIAVGIRATVGRRRE